MLRLMSCLAVLMVLVGVGVTEAAGGETSPYTQTSPTGSGLVLLHDSFDGMNDVANLTGQPHNVHVNSDLTARQGGSSLGTVPYLVDVGGGSNPPYRNPHISANALVMQGGDKRSQIIAPLHNFVDAAITDTGGFAIDFTANPTGSNTSMHWLAVSFGHTYADAVDAPDGVTVLNEPDADFGILFRGDGRFSTFGDGTFGGHAGTYASGHGPDDFFDFHIAVETDSFDAGQPATVRVFVNNQELDVGPALGDELFFMWDADESNYISLESRILPSVVGDFTVSTIPEPSTLVLLTRTPRIQVSRPRRNRLVLERLEPRLQLDAGPLLINEFMAINTSTLADEDGAYSDWIEIYNPSASAVDLDGWHLTDNDANLTKWTFPARTLAADEYLLVFASDKDRTGALPAGGEPHTNFKLDGDGEYLALVQPDGTTISHQYAPEYPSQTADVSYGIGTSTTATDLLVASGAAARFHVPGPGEDMAAWTADDFDDTGWADRFTLDKARALISEVTATGSLHGIEVQNVSLAAIDVDGWKVLVNDASSGRINDVGNLAWDLSGQMAAETVLYRTDDPGAGDNYWGEPIPWQSEGDGWVMILDDVGNVVDFVAWGYDAAEIASLQIDFAQFTDIVVGNHWTGNGVDLSGGKLLPQENAISFGSPWNYLHPLDGRDPDSVDPDFVATWMRPTGYDGPAFDRSGPAILGYGGIDRPPGIVTNIGTPGAGDRYTAYFRTQFTITDAMVNAAVEIFSDDGAVIYIDGAGPYRNNFSGADTYHALADDTGDESGTKTLAIPDLSAGTHTIAVSVHQSHASTSSDVGFDLRLYGQPVAGPAEGLARLGIRDNDVEADFDQTNDPTLGVQNAEMTVPFGEVLPVRTGIGYSNGSPDFTGTIATDVSEPMQGVNTSLWTRIDFQAEDLLEFDTLTLRMQYDDGFVAYLNGQEIASAGDPDPLAYNSAATGDRSDALATVFEEIDVTAHHALLQTGTNVLAVHGLDSTVADSGFLVLPELVASGIRYIEQAFVRPTPGETNLTTGVVINEFLARNDGGLQDEDGAYPDWIELYNPTADAVELEGWYLTDDATDLTRWEFPDVTLASGEYLVVFASNKDRTDPLGELHTNFKLDGSGEYLALVGPDGLSAVHAYAPGFPPQFDDVSYGLAADGSNTPGYFTAPTPGEANGPLAVSQGPIITDVTENPPPPADADDLTITAEVYPTGAAIDQVTLTYRVMFGAERPLSMVDDGTQGDATAGDGIYSAVIPHTAAAPGEMVRWYVTAVDTEGNTSRDPVWNLPYVDHNNAPEYFGTVVTDPGVSSKIPIMEWFVEDPEAARTDAGTRASVFFDGLFYDNFFVRRRGWSTLGWAKRKFKFDFNSGNYFRYSADERPVEEFNLQSHYSEIGSVSYMRENLGFAWIDEAGGAASKTFHTQLRQNGEFYGLYSFVEQVDETFLQRNGFDPDGAMYKALQNGTLAPNPTTNNYRKATQKDEPWTDFIEFTTGLSSANRFDYVMDAVDVAQVINEMAAQTIMPNHDRLIKNYYVYREPDTQQWHRFPWDMDQPFAVGSKMNSDPWGNVLFGDSQHVQEPGHADWLNYLHDAILDNPVTREMYLRRLRTLMDQYHDVSTGYFEGLINDYYTLIEAEADLDNAKWGRGNIDNGVNQLLTQNLPQRRAFLLNDPLVPSPQTGSPAIWIGTVDFNPASGDQDQEYIELLNPGAVAVDVSGWRIEGAVDWMFQPGTVIPSGGSLYVVADVLGFLARPTGPGGGQGLFVQGNHEGHLSNLGGSLTLISADEQTMDEATYVGSPSLAQQYLRISEINYNPPEPTPEEIAAGFTSNEDFEFLELLNMSTAPAGTGEDIQLVGEILVDGVQFQVSDDFNLTDWSGHFGMGELLGGAAVVDGMLQLDADTFGSMVAGAYHGPDITAKTLMAWVYVDDANQVGGGVMTLQNASPAEETFDGIVYAQQESGKWMAGSEEFNRTQDSPQGGTPETAAGQLVHVAVVYGSDDSIAVYRNGQPYAAYTKGSVPIYTDADEIIMSFGRRPSDDAPPVATGLRLWLDAGDTNADGVFDAWPNSTPVAEWRDKSPGGAGSVAQGDVSMQPRVKTDYLGGQPVVQLDGNDFLAGLPVLDAGDDTFTYFAVWQPHVTGVQAIFEQAGAGTGARASLLAVGDRYGFNGQNNDAHNLAPYAANQWRISAMVLDGTADSNVHVYDNGTEYVGTVNIQTQNLGTLGTRVGAKVTDNSERFDGDIAEILVYDHVLSAEEHALVDSYLAGKYGLPTALAAAPGGPANAAPGVESPFFTGRIDEARLYAAALLPQQIADAAAARGVAAELVGHWTFEDQEVATLAPGERVLLVNNRTAFEARYGTGHNVVGEYAGRLSNGGEQIVLMDPFGEAAFDFRYNDADGWPGRADGKGASLELIDPTDVPDGEPARSEYLSDPDNWQSSSAYLGTPGTAAEPHQGVVINEVLSHTDWPQVDSVELVNVTDQPVDIGGWYLSDSWGWDPLVVDGGDNNYKKFCIPDGTTLAPGQYVTFDESHFNPTPVDPLPNHFALDGAHGDDVWLMRADAQGDLTHFGDHVDLGAQANGESWGRWAGGGLYPMTRLTPDGPNSGPRLGSVAVSEVHYNPGDMPDDSIIAADDLEFVEIYNSGTTAVDLTDWRLDKAVDYDFPAGTMLGGLDTLVVVSFDPVMEPAKLAAFTSHYSVEYPIHLFGPYGGQLRDDGERVQLQYPDEEPADEPGFIPHLLEDEVTYDDDSGWPIAADGSGDSLHRTGTATWGNDPAHWTAALPTPGLVQFDPYVAGRYVFYNESSFNGDAAIATDKRALLPGGVGDFANYTSYVRGLNGIMVDLANLPDGVTPGAGDFQFRFGTASSAAGGPGDTPGDWPAASPENVTVRPGDGDSARVTITFNSGELRNGWLQVTVAADALGLSDDDVFYFGNAVAEAGNSTTEARVTTADLLLARNNPRDSISSPAGITFPYDYDRDGAVNATDVLLARNNQTNFLSALQLIDLTGGAEAAQEPPLANLAWLTDLDQPATQRPAEKNAAAEAVDLLLATLWS